MWTWAPNGLPGPTWSWLTTSTASTISALVFWSKSGWPHASPATRVQKSPNLGLIAFRPRCNSWSSSTALACRAPLPLPAAGRGRCFVCMVVLLAGAVEQLLDPPGRLAEFELLAARPLAVEKRTPVEVAEVAVGVAGDGVPRVVPELVDTILQRDAAPLRPGLHADAAVARHADPAPAALLLQVAGEGVDVRVLAHAETEVGHAGGPDGGGRRPAEDRPRVRVAEVQQLHRRVAERDEAHVEHPPR